MTQYHLPTEHYTERSLRVHGEPSLLIAVSVDILKVASHLWKFTVRGRRPTDRESIE